MDWFYFLSLFSPLCLLCAPVHWLPNELMGEFSISKFNSDFFGFIYLKILDSSERADISWNTPPFTTVLWMS
jgi:hypothetical protein